jgi:hypothetical protein
MCRHLQHLSVLFPPALEQRAFVDACVAAKLLLNLARGDEG